MTLIHCAGFKISAVVRSAGDLYAVAIKFNDFVYGIISIPDTISNTLLIHGQIGQVILKFPGGNVGETPKDYIEFCNWLIPEGRWGLKFLVKGTGGVGHVKYVGFNLSPTQMAGAIGPFITVNYTLPSIAFTFGGSRLRESGLISQSPTPPAYNRFNTIGEPNASGDSTSASQTIYVSGTNYLRAQDGFNVTSSLMPSSFIVSSTLDFTWVILL